MQSRLLSAPRESSISLEAVVQHFSQTAPTKRKLALGSNEELAKPVTVEVVEVSSDEESSEEEVTIILEKSTACPVSKEISSSYSSGRIVLASVISSISLLY